MKIEEFSGEPVDPSLLLGGDVKFMWDIDWYDGPIEGIVEYEGRPCWATWVGDTKIPDQGWFRAFALVEISKSEYEFERSEYDLFVRFVKGQPTSEWTKYYDRPEFDEDRREREYGDRDVIGLITWPGRDP